MDMNAVRHLYDHYHQKVKIQPNLYLRYTGDAVDVMLPVGLYPYANSASGHAGWSTGARPRGIRRMTSNPKDFREQIFSSVDSLVAFLETSECDFSAYAQNLKNKYLASGKKIKASKPRFKTARDALIYVMNIVPGKYKMPKVNDAVKLISGIEQMRLETDQELLDAAEDALFQYQR